MNHTQLAPEDVLAKAKRLLAEAEALLHATAGDRSRTANEARTRLLAGLDRTKLVCEAIQVQRTPRLRVTLRRTDSTVRGHPYESIAIVFGIGVFLGYAFTHQRANHTPVLD
jgi:ElaB/YqjD/DUF883 family membrane-anchored ribosome-binding protein